MLLLKTTQILCAKRLRANAFRIIASYSAKNSSISTAQIRAELQRRAFHRFQENLLKPMKYQEKCQPRDPNRKKTSGFMSFFDVRKYASGTRPPGPPRQTFSAVEKCNETHGFSTKVPPKTLSKRPIYSFRQGF